MIKKFLKKISLLFLILIINNYLYFDGYYSIPYALSEIPGEFEFILFSSSKLEDFPPAVIRTYSKINNESKVIFKGTFFQPGLEKEILYSDLRYLPIDIKGDFSEKCKSLNDFIKNEYDGSTFSIAKYKKSIYKVSLILNEDKYIRKTIYTYFTDGVKIIKSYNPVYINGITGFLINLGVIIIFVFFYIFKIIYRLYARRHKML